MVDSHAHLTFPSAVGYIDPSFNPPVDVSFFRHMPTPEEHFGIARRNVEIMLDQGFTSSYSAGSLTPVPTEVRLRDEIAAGAIPGPRMRGMELHPRAGRDRIRRGQAADEQRRRVRRGWLDDHPVQPGGGPGRG
jgi:hypothetical protein